MFSEEKLLLVKHSHWLDHHVGTYIVHVLFVGTTAKNSQLISKIKQQPCND